MPNGLSAVPLAGGDPPCLRAGTRLSDPLPLSTPRPSKRGAFAVRLLPSGPDPVPASKAFGVPSGTIPATDHLRGQGFTVEQGLLRTPVAMQGMRPRCRLREWGRLLPAWSPPVAGTRSDRASRATQVLYIRGARRKCLDGAVARSGGLACGRVRAALRSALSASKASASVGLKSRFLAALRSALSAQYTDSGRTGTRSS